MALIWASVKGIPGLEMSAMTAWLGIIAYTLQIYFDFSSYSDMAIGLGYMMGFEWAENLTILMWPSLQQSFGEDGTYH